MNTDERAAAALLRKYEAALNRGSADDVANLYADDGILMPENSTSKAGTAAIRRTYAGGFTQIAFNIKFDIVEVRQVAPGWIFARTTSTGTMKLVAGNKTIPESNQELFVLQKTAGVWKIARYSYSTTNPA